MSNHQLACDVLKACAAVGMREVVLCAGARNAPLVHALSLSSDSSSLPEGLQTYSFFEERSAAFFALGRMQSTGRPVAVVTTSGTAAAELLPAAIEADYQGLPLILITADRPKHYRGSGAPQTIHQPGLFSHYVENTWDIEGTWTDKLQWSQRRPVHINVCFDEPLLDAPEMSGPDVLINPEKVRRSFSANLLAEKERPTFSGGDESGAEKPVPGFSAPVILLGGLPAKDVERVRAWLSRCGRPVYAEAASQLRGRLGDREILEADLRELRFDGVIRIGGVPTLRFWRDLEKSTLPVWHFSHLPFSGLPRTPRVWPMSSLADWKFELWQPTQEVGARKVRLGSLLEKYSLSEPGLVNWLSRQLPENSRLFLGNSLPIREWDLAASMDCRSEIFVNRGVNGIDGLISTFLGVAEPGRSNWALIGDLSALYDMTGPWALSQRELEDVNLVVINNGGGKIFHRIFRNPLFENRHDLHFEHWARMWDWDYVRFNEPAALPPNTGRPRVIEIVPSNEHTEKFWQEWETKK